MWRRMLTVWGALAGLTMLGCGGSSTGDVATPTPTSTPTPTPSPATYLYFGSWDSSMSAYHFNESTGAVSPLSASQARGSWIVEHPSRPFLYGYALDSSRAVAYQVDAATGALASIPGSQTPSLIGWHVYPDPGGDFLYSLGGSDAPGLRAFRLDRSTGAILSETPGSPFAFGLGAAEVLRPPSGESVYVPAFSPNGFWAFRVDRTAGALVPIVGSPFAGFDPPQTKAAVFHPSQPLVFLRESDSIATIRIDGATRAPSVLYREHMSGPVYGMAIDPAGHHLFASFWKDTIRTLDIDQSTGQLRPTSGQFLSASARFKEMFVHPSGQLLFVRMTASGDPDSPSEIVVLAIDQTTGALTEISGSPFSLDDHFTVMLGWDLRMLFLAEGRWMVVGGDRYMHRFSISVTPPSVTALGRVSQPSTSVAVYRTPR